ncbi:VanZ family protein [Clostridium sp.]|uniref:VanZ family protein n=1 Tax=Clostridium sp. TaxID=1506 RepID=UPI002FDEA1DA
MIAFRSNSRIRSSFSLKREVILNVFFIYILCFIGVTLFPLKISLDRDYTWISVNVIPVMSTVKEITNITNDPNMHSFMIKFWIKNIGGNLILLFPLGVMVPILWSKFNSAIKTTFFAFCLSLSIEVLQLLSTYIGNAGRAFDIDDILLNTVGAYIGYIFYKKFIKNNKSILNKYLQNG